MKVLIIEDEIHNQRLLHGMLTELRPDWEVVRLFVSIKDSVDWFNTNQSPDLIFMDIQLVDGNCFEIFDEVDILAPVIFTTAYDEYAIQAFKVNTIDYLLKPIKEDELSFSIKKFEKIISILKKSEQSVNFEDVMNAIKSGQHQFRKRFLVSKGDSYVKIKISEVAFFYSEHKTTYLVTFKNMRHIIDYTLEKLEDELDPIRFYRANRQFIITLDVVRKIETHFGGKLIVKLNHPFDDEITISRLKATDFKHWIDQ